MFKIVLWGGLVGIVDCRDFTVVVDCRDFTVVVDLAQVQKGLAASCSTQGLLLVMHC